MNESDRERINWIAGKDRITIDQFSKFGSNYTKDASQSYTVNSRTPESPYTDKGSLESASPITWGEADTYRFFGFYPAGKGTLNSGDDGYWKTTDLTLPATQTYPVDMNYAYMYAVTDDIQKPAPGSNTPVKLQFTPMVTTLQFEICKSFDGEMTIQSMELESVATTKQAICGDYVYNLSQQSDPTKRNDAAATERNSDSDSKITIDLNSTSVSSDVEIPVVVDFFLIPQTYKGEELKLTIEATVDGVATTYSNILKFKSDALNEIKPNYKYDMSVVLDKKEIILTTAGKELVFYTIVKICKNEIIDAVLKGKTTPSGDNELYGEKLSTMSTHCGVSDYSNFFNDLLNYYVRTDKLQNDREAKDAFLTDFLDLFDEEMSEILEVIGSIKSVSLNFGGNQGISLDLNNNELSLFKSLTEIDIDINDNLDVAITLEDMPYLQNVTTDHGVTYTFKNCPNLENINLQNFQNASEYNVVIDNCPKFTTLNSSNFKITSKLEDTKITILNMPNLESVELTQGGPKSLTISDCEKITSLTLNDNNKKTQSLTLTDLPVFKSGTVTRNLDDNNFLLTISNVSNCLASGENATLAISGSGNCKAGSSKTESPNLTVTASGSPILREFDEM